MEHLLLKAATTATDEGTFTAVISTAAVDRDGDVVDPDGLVRALHKWASTNKNIPLAWHHSMAAEDQIGHIVPTSAKNVDGNVVVDGWIDESVDPAGKHAWRLVKSGTLGFSYGYLVEKSTKRGSNGGQHITELDVFEITATPIPANNETRVIGWKSVEERDAVLVELQEVKVRLETLEKTLEDPKTQEGGGDGQGAKARSVDPLRQQAEAIALDIASGGLDRLPQKQAKAPAQEPDLIDLKTLRQRSRDLMLQVLSGTE